MTTKEGFVGEPIKCITKGIDQILNLVNGLIKDPDSRYHIVSAWNPTVIANKLACLPSCHILFQCSISKSKYLDLFIYQRSCDTPLGVPYNIASYALLVNIFCALTGYEPGTLHWTGGSVHIYENQIQTMHEQLKRTPTTLPHLICCLQEDSDIFDVNAHITDQTPYTKKELHKLFVPEKWDINVQNALGPYNPQSVINFPFSSGKDKFCKVVALLNVAQDKTESDAYKFDHKANMTYWFTHNIKMTKKFLKNSIIMTDEQSLQYFKDWGMLHNHNIHVAQDKDDFVQSIRDMRVYDLDKTIYVIGDFKLYADVFTAGLVDVIYGHCSIGPIDPDAGYPKLDIESFDEIWTSYLDYDTYSYQFICHNKDFIKSYIK